MSLRVECPETVARSRRRALIAAADLSTDWTWSGFPLQFVERRTLMRGDRRWEITGWTLTIRPTIYGSLGIVRNYQSRKRSFSKYMIPIFLTFISFISLEH